MKVKTNIDENIELIKINFDQLDKTNKTIVNENLFDHLDWLTQFNEQVIPLKRKYFHFSLISLGFT